MAAFSGGYSERDKAGISFELKDYLELVDYTGRAVRDDKRGSINESPPPILERLGTTKDD